MHVLIELCGSGHTGAAGDGRDAAGCASAARSVCVGAEEDGDSGVIARPVAKRR